VVDYLEEAVEYLEFVAIVIRLSSVSLFFSLSSASWPSRSSTQFSLNVIAFPFLFKSVRSGWF
jgi:hypothetical protein